MLRASGGEAFGYTCNLGNREEVYEVCRKIMAEQGPVTMLVNNAGIVSGADLLDTDDGEVFDILLYDLTLYARCVSYNLLKLYFQKKSN
jgi:NAD(P)-dependent dehydrogenase (short-subunit alcohol dehydrogenase family)